MSTIRNSITTVLMLALVVFFVSGCGGSDETAAPTPTSTSTSSGAASGQRAQRGEKPEDIVGQAIKPTDQTAKEVRRALEQGEAVVIIFYMTGPYDDSQTRTALSQVEGRFREQAKFFSYMYSDGQKYGDLASLLKVNTTPTVIVINRQGRVQQAWTGFVDAAVIEQGVIEATS